MANRESFIFDVNADISQAMSGLEKVKRAMDDIDSLRKKGEGKGRTTSNKDMLDAMRIAKQAAQEYRNLQKQLKDLDRQIKTSSNKMLNKDQSAELKKRTGLNMNTKKEYQNFIKNQQREMKRMQDGIRRAQNDMARFGQTYSKNFQTNYQQKGIMHVDTKNLGEAKKVVQGVLDETRKTSGELDDVIKKIKEAKKLDRRAESLSRRASASNYMSHQQASNFTKDLNTSRVDYRNYKDANVTRLTQISTDITKFAQQISDIERKPNATQDDITKRSKLQENIAALDREWSARSELNKVLEETTANMERYNQSLQGVEKKPERGTWRGMAYERAPAIALAVMGAVTAAVGKLYNQGGSLSREMRGNEVYIGQQTGEAGGSWRSNVRNNAMEAGLKNRLGFTGVEMLGFQESYLTAKGFTNRKDLTSAMEGQATFSRATGIDASETKDFFNTAYRSGGLSGLQTKSFQNAFLGAIKQSGMEGREKDQLKALDGILNGMSQNRSISSQDMMRTVGLQSVLAGSGVGALQGSKGGALMASMDEGIRKGFDDPSLRVLFGQGTKFQGMEGRRALRKQMEQGVSNVDNVNTMIDAAMAQGGGSRDAQIEALTSLAHRMGIDMSDQQSEGLFKLKEQGKLTKGNIDKIMKDSAKEGAKESKKRQENYEKSSAATDSQSESVTAKQAVGINDMGEAVRKANAALGGLPAPLYAAVVAVGAFTASMLAAAVAFRGAGMIRGGLAQTYGNGGGGAGGGVGGAGRGAGTAAGAGAAASQGTFAEGVVPSTGGVSNGATRQYQGANNGGIFSGIKNFFDPSARAGGLPNLGTGEALAAGATVAGGAAAANSFPNLFKGGLKDSVALKGLNKIMLPLAALSAYSTITSAPDEKKGEATGSAVGGIGGSILGGAAAGAAAGSIIPGAGTLVGGAIGIAGGLLGGLLGSSVGGGIGSWFDSDEPKDTAPAEMTSEPTVAPTNTSNVTGAPSVSTMPNANGAVDVTTMPNMGGTANQITNMVDKENTNTKKQTEGKKTDNLAYERENLSLYERMLLKAEQILAQARAQNGIMGMGQGGAAGGANGINGFTGGGSLKFLPDGQKWSNSNLTQHDLGTTDQKLTAEDLDSWINSKAPEGSMMRGMGAVFLKAGQETGLDPRYLIAHAAEESAWGTSKIARDKGNFFGIGAFDDSPYASAFEFKDGSGSAAERGIMGGAKWIADKYYGKGRTTLDAMHKAGYATNSDWATNIASIMKGAPSGSGSGNVTATINVNVKGDEKVSDKIKSSSDMKKVGTNVGNMLGFFSREMVVV
ncbi:tape measure protein [Bacillus phage Anthony]|uniref:Tape measure protein n=1 Tax=Bacillus phage Anthony TaxID=2024253 RepID=A0A223LFR1_9CAUD|nr:tape measure protein [Bacillus phage Anthony]